MAKCECQRFLRQSDTGRIFEMNPGLAKRVETGEFRYIMGRLDIGNLDKTGVEKFIECTCFDEEVEEEEEPNLEIPSSRSGAQPIADTTWNDIARKKVEELRAYAFENFGKTFPEETDYNEIKKTVWAMVKGAQERLAAGTTEE